MRITNFAISIPCFVINTKRPSFGTLLQPLEYPYSHKTIAFYSKNHPSYLSTFAYRPPPRYVVPNLEIKRVDGTNIKIRLKLLSVPFNIYDERMRTYAMCCCRFFNFRMLDLKFFIKCDQYSVAGTYFN